MIQIMKSFKKEYLDLSLCSFDYEPHGSLARPYETESEQLTHPE